MRQHPVRETVRPKNGWPSMFLIPLVGPAGLLGVNENGHLARTETTGNDDVSLYLSHSAVSQSGWLVGSRALRRSPMLSDSSIRGEHCERSSARAETGC